MRVNIMKLIKEYLAFTSFVYRSVMFGIMPLVCIVGYICVGVFNHNYAGVLFSAMPVMVLVAEIVADTWLFGGIQGKDAAKIDYLKTSPKGMGMLRNALAMDLVRRVLFLLLVMTVCALANIDLGVDMYGGDWARRLAITLSLILSSYMVSVLCILFARFGAMLWQNMLAAYLGIFLESVCIGAVIAFDHPFAWAFLYAVLAAGASVLAVKTAMKKVRGGYYDK